MNAQHTVAVERDLMRLYDLQVRKTVFTSRYAERESAGTHSKQTGSAFARGKVHPFDSGNPQTPRKRLDVRCG